MHKVIIEAKAIEFLKFIMCMEDVYAELPETVPDSFLLVGVVDRIKKNQITTATLEVYSYETSKARAASLDAKVRQCLPLIVSDDSISGCKLQGGDDVPDAWLEKYRYRSLFNIVYYDE